MVLKARRSSAWRLMGATLVAVLLACLVFCLPCLTGLLSYNRELVMQGEVWRIITSHWTHWTGAHLFWDALAFSVLLFLALRIHVMRTVCLLVSASILVPLAILLFCSTLSEYRGLSGLDSALYVFVGLVLLRRCREPKDAGGTMLVGAILAGFVGKVVFELVTGQTIFVVSMGAGIVGVPLAHIIGAAVGSLFSGNGASNISTGRFAAGIDFDADVH